MEGKYQAYPEYKKSEIKWFGSIPIGWGIAPLRRSLVEHKQGYYTTDSYVDDGVKLLRITDLRDYGEIDIRYCPQVSASDQSLANFELKDGDVIFARTGGAGSFGVVRNLSERVVFASYLIRFRFYDSHFENGYLRYMLLADSFQKAVKQNIHGGVNQNIHAEDIKNSYLARPSIGEQRKIANFLDHETAKIDTLIEKQQQLIKLLKEKRQAVISHAVTKGLNPDAPMRDSGVEWLGEVPEHWKVLRINQLFSESSSRASSDIELAYPVLTVSIHNGISDKELNEEELDRKAQRSEDRSLYKVVQSNFLAYNMMRAWQGGFGASKVGGLVSPAYVVCQPKTILNSSYFELVLRTPNAVVELKRFSRGITDFRLRLYWDEFKNINVPVPPEAEINSILKSISNTNSVYDRLESVAKKQIKFLQERRTALISAAVTGKIDVRDWQAPEPSFSEAKEAIA